MTDAEHRAQYSGDLKGFTSTSALNRTRPTAEKIRLGEIA